MALATLSNGDLIVGGAFATAGGVVANGIARWNGSTWSTFGSGVSGGNVTALAALPNGRFVAGGGFTSVGGVSARNVARWNGSTWQALGSSVWNGGVNALAALPSGDIIAAGGFSVAGGVPATGIARWNGTAWSALGSGVYPVSALAVLPNGDVVAGGSFTTAGGVQANRIARWNGATWAPLGSGMDGFIYALTVLPNGDLVAGGSFTTAGGVQANRIAKWDGVAWSPLGSGLGGDAVYALAALPNGGVIASENASGGVVQSVMLWDGERWESLGSGFNHFVRALSALPSGDVVAGGVFDSAGGTLALKIARFDGTVWTPLGVGAGLNGEVNALLVTRQGDLIAGGVWSAAGGEPAGSIARWDRASWHPLGSGLGGNIGSHSRVQSIVESLSGVLYVCGNFTSAGGVPARAVARWDGTAWSPVGWSYDFGPAVLAVMHNGDLIAGGYFDPFGKSYIPNNIARWNGATWETLGSGVAGPSPGAGSPGVQALTVMPNGDLIAGGDFAIPARNIARWNGSAWAPLGLGRPAPVHALAVLPSGELIAAGSFGVAKWDGSGWVDLGAPTNSSGIAYVFALTLLSNGDLIAGGNFTAMNGVASNRLARWNGAGWAPIGSGVDGGSSNIVYALATLPDGELIAGGNFTTAGGLVSGFWARWADDPHPRIATPPTPQAAAAFGAATFAVVPSPGYEFGSPLYYQWRRNGADVTNGTTPHGTIVSGANDAILSLSNLSTLDSGRYSVVVANACGYSTSSGELLTVGDSACPGDANGDAAIDFADLNVVLGWFGQPAQVPGTSGDVDGDGDCDFIDLNIVLSNYGVSC